MVTVVRMTTASIAIRSFVFFEYGNSQNQLLLCILGELVVKLKLSFPNTEVEGKHWKIFDPCFLWHPLAMSQLAAVVIILFKMIFIIIKNEMQKVINYFAPSS